MRGNPNSKRGQVRTAFNSGGEKEALSVGKSLGLPEAKIRRWVRKFTEAATPSRAVGKRFVALTYWPEKIGTIVEAGDEVSEVKFLDGSYAFVTNEKLTPVER